MLLFFLVVRNMLFTRLPAHLSLNRNVKNNSVGFRSFKNLVSPTGPSFTTTFVAHLGAECLTTLGSLLSGSFLQKVKRLDSHFLHGVSMSTPY